MRNKLGELSIGLILIVSGIILGGNAIKIWDIKLFFDGWWTLFIIVPCGIDMIKRGVNIGNLVGVFVGVLLLISSLGIVSKDMIIKSIIPLILILIGINIIFRNIKTKKKQILIPNKGQIKHIYTIFGGQDINPINQEFYGASITALFGDIKLDLRNVTINEDVIINSTTVFGRVEIFVPSNVKVKVSSIPIFGGVGNKSVNSKVKGAPTIYVNATCIFIGIDIK